MNDTDKSLFMDTVSMAESSEIVTGRLTKEAGVPQRNYKDTVFRLLFNDREKLLSLFNAVNGTSGCTCMSTSPPSTPTCRSEICSMWQGSMKN